MQPRYRSKSVRTLKVKTKNRTKLRFKRRQSKNKSCAACKSAIPLNSRADRRKFGGQLCTRCSRAAIIYGARVRRGEIAITEVALKYRKYISI